MSLIQSFGLGAWCVISLCSGSLTLSHRRLLLVYICVALKFKMNTQFFNEKYVFLLISIYTRMFIYVFPETLWQYMHVSFFLPVLESRAYKIWSSMATVRPASVWRPLWPTSAETPREPCPYTPLYCPVATADRRRLGPSLKPARVIYSHSVIDDNVAGR